MGFWSTTLIFFLAGVIASLSLRLCCNRGPSTVDDPSSSSSVTDFRGLSRSNTVPVKVYNAALPEASTSNSNLERSRTERQRQANARPTRLSKLFDDKISDKKKLRILTRITTVNKDGTLEVELPSSVEPPLDLRSQNNNGDVVDEEEQVDFRYMRPLQIAILIVGYTWRCAAICRDW